ncbi:hypothetical protein [Solimonas marina]|uniref:Glycine zipper domain-containing protein n=1 Tax=Solimonas marina TaxID=2714601 RepID=A0A970B6I3_9GAMM|nr:hypothetical protein [Solimonas marina]NKF24517.1 hypothetical protein [Solimonas marina]
MSSTLTCPRCGATEILSRNHARKAGCIIGAAAGATSSFAAALGGAEVGAAMCFIAGPPGVILGSIGGAMMGALLGGAAGCATGAIIGSTIDDEVLDNYQCERCKHAFGKRHLDVCQI